MACVSGEEGIEKLHEWCGPPTLLRHANLTVMLGFPKLHFDLCFVPFFPSSSTVCKVNTTLLAIESPTT
ncbi:hypothetical protein VNO78_21170 [Psophocarpus tetragonolobus]|uniref:Uncharacterized protein n=1 Tax=Psophocarpus tetragonolobus TaxID=3891 RepID=A0AAN9XHV1_PSOTE